MVNYLINGNVLIGQLLITIFKYKPQNAIWVEDLDVCCMFVLSIIPSSDSACSSVVSIVSY